MYFIVDKVLKTFAARNIPPSEFITHILYTVQVYSVCYVYKVYIENQFQTTFAQGGDKIC